LISSFHPPFVLFVCWSRSPCKGPLTVHRELTSLLNKPFPQSLILLSERFTIAQRMRISSNGIKKEAMNNLQRPWHCINKKAVGNLGAARGLSPYLGAGQWAGSSLFHHQHHQEVEATMYAIAPPSSGVSITKRL
jgi:hypothetical protein